MAVPVIAASGAAAAGTGTSLAVPYPSGINSGDLLIFAYCNGSANFNGSTPSGWTLELAQQQGTTVQTSVFSKIAAGSESGNLSFTGLRSGDSHIARMHRITGGDTIEAVNSSGASSKTVTHPSTTTSWADSLVMQFTGINDDETAASFTGETGGDLTLHSQDSGTGGNDVALSLQTAGLASAGTISGGSWTYAGATEAFVTIGLAVYTNVDPTYDQDSYRFRNDDGTASTATWMANVNTVPPDIDLDTNFRIRFLVQTNDFTTSDQDVGFNAYYRIDTGGGFGSWGLITSSTELEHISSPNYNTAQDNNQRIGSGTLADGYIIESSAIISSTNLTDIGPVEEYELEYCFHCDSGAPTPAEGGDVIEVRLVLGGVDLDSYTNTASFTVAGAGVGLTFLPPHRRQPNLRF